MRPETIHLLRCSRCHDGRMEVRARVSSEDEIREGNLTCLACGETFFISGGVVEMLRSPSHQASEEIEDIDPGCRKLTE